MPFRYHNKSRLWILADVRARPLRPSRPASFSFSRGFPTSNLANKIWIDTVTTSPLKFRFLPSSLLCLSAKITVFQERTSRNFIPLQLYFYITFIDHPFCRHLTFVLINLIISLGGQYFYAFLPGFCMFLVKKQRERFCDQLVEISEMLIRFGWDSDLCSSNRKMLKKIYLLLLSYLLDYCTMIAFTAVLSS